MITESIHQFMPTQERIDFEVNRKHNLQTEKFYEQSVMRDVL